MTPKSMLGGKKEKTNMKIRILFCLLLCLAVGCKTEKPTDDGDRLQPIVSPTNVSDEKQDGDAPHFPYFIPWWAK